MSSSKSSTEVADHPGVGPSHGLTSGLEFTYDSLPVALHSRVAPSPVQDPVLVILNAPLAQDLGLDPVQLQDASSVRLLAGAATLPHGLALAQAYAGHQFGHFTVLGDGRAVLLGELLTPDGRRVDIQLKGAGQTPYSRRGDGRAALAPMLREYLVSEAMYALGVPTTRSLAVVSTGEAVYRERPYPGAVLTRVAASHIRVGTFQYAALQSDDTLKALADYSIQRHDPDLQGASNPYLGLLNRVIERQAKLIAQWMLFGFVHGVMNTDNVSIAGETIDYGPCAFMDRYDPATVFSSIDSQGRYAYGNQPAIGHWNLCRFAESLLPLLDADEAKALELAQVAINAYRHIYDTAWRSGMAGKLGFSRRTEDIDRLSDEFLHLLQTTGTDYTNSFRALMRGEAMHELFAPWLQRWNRLIEQQPGGRAAALERMAKANPVVIPRNHLVQAALDQAEQGDMTRFHELLSACQTPYDPTHEGTIYAAAPPADAERYVTYCGT